MLYGGRAQDECWDTLAAGDRALTTIRDDALRARFCRLYRQAFPGDTEHGCTAGRPRPATIVTAEGDLPLTGPWPQPAP